MATSRFIPRGLKLAAVVCMFAMSCILNLWSPVQATTWTDIEQITTVGVEYDACIAGSPDGKVWVAWTQGNQIRCRFWDEGTWSDTEGVSSEGANGAFESAIAAGPDSSIHVVWSESTPGHQTTTLHYRKWKGSVWSDDLMLMSDSTASARQPDIAVDSSGYVHVVCNMYTGGPQCVVRYTSWDGNSWSAPQTLSQDLYAGKARIACDGGGRVHVVWADGSVYYTRHESAGWTTPEIISLTNGVDSPSLYADTSGNVRVVWVQGYDLLSGVMYRMWNGSSWDDQQLVAGINYGDMASPKIIRDHHNQLHLVWYHYNNGTGGVYYKPLFEDPLYADRSIGTPYGSAPSIAIDAGGGFHVVWTGNQDGNSYIYHRMRKQCLDGDVLGDCRSAYWGWQLFDERYTANADTFSQPLGDPVYYDSTKVTINRTANDRFFLSGRSDQLTSWIADDKVYVNGVDAGLGFSGVIDPAYPLCQPIETVLQPAEPRDVTDLIPLGESCVVFKLADTQRAILGNTRIYLVRQDVTGVLETGLPSSPILSVTPNPARSSTAIRLVASQAGLYRVSIQTVDGRLVQSWPAARLTAGEQRQWFWNGQAAGPGVYFGTVQTPEGRSSKKILIVR